MSTVPEVRTGRFPRSTIDEVVEPVERADPGRKGLAVCLSGGGYRATLYHLGAVRRLYELGILNKVDTFSSVSGGSIFAAVLADLAIRRDWEDGLAISDFETEVASPVRELTQHDLRTVPFLATLPINWAAPGPRARQLQRRLERHLSRARLGELPKQPNFIMCATDLYNGVSWESSRDDTRSWKTRRFSGASEWPLAWAVAASACFPPIFGPIPLPSHGNGSQGPGPGTTENGNQDASITLSDGGVYDNMGLEPVWKTHACVLVSDAGAPFRFCTGRTPLRRLTRYTSVIMKQAHSLRLRMLFDQLDRGRYKGTWWGIGPSHRPPPVGYPTELVQLIADIRTDLDRFTEDEQKILENHGYWSAEEQIQKRLPELVADGSPDAEWPHEEWRDKDKVRRALSKSGKRFSLTRMVGRA